MCLPTLTTAASVCMNQQWYCHGFSFYTHFWSLLTTGNQYERQVPASPCNSESNQSMTTFIYPGNRIPGLVAPSSAEVPYIVQNFYPQHNYVSVIYSSPSGYNTEKYNQPHAAFIKHCLETCLGSPDKTYVIPYAIIYQYASLPTYAYLYVLRFTELHYRQ